jgi:hypothetical protein
MDGQIGIWKKRKTHMQSEKKKHVIMLLYSLQLQLLTLADLTSSLQQMSIE